MSRRPHVRIAFHTPLKPIDHPVASGDRTMARELVVLLRRLGHRVTLIDRWRAGQRVLLPAAAQLGEARAARGRVQRIVEAWRRLPHGHHGRFDLWMTYHVYYKKPDLLGPRVAEALGMPYVVVEASHAPKRRIGPWRVGHRLVETALARADLALTLNPNDAACLRPRLRRDAALQLLPPFLDAAPYAEALGHSERNRADLCAAAGLDPARPILLTVAMMRAGDKLASYRLLARALAEVEASDWQLAIAGDGECRLEVERAFAPFGERVRLLGLRSPASLPALYSACDLYVWPAINEAYGMTLLEAQAGGLAVVAGRTGGVPAVVRDGVSGLLPPIGDAPAFAMAVARLLRQPATLAAMRQAAPSYIAGHHARDVVGHALQLALRRTVARSAATRGYRRG